jgi:hypothetical protein
MSAKESIEYIVNASPELVAKLMTKTVKKLWSESEEATEGGSDFVLVRCSELRMMLVAITSTTPLKAAAAYQDSARAALEEPESP